MLRSTLHGFAVAGALALGLFTGLAFAAGERPSTPTDLAGAVDGTTVTLNWTASTDDEGVEGYNVYRNDQYISTVFDTRYTGTVEADTVYTFRVVAFDAEPRNFSPASDSLTLPESLVPDDLTIPPSRPTDLAGSIDATTVTLNWTASTDDESVRGYNIYRDNQYIATRFGTSYSGAVEADRSYRFYVVAFDIRSNFSPRSDSITLPDEGPVDTTVRPEPPTNLAGTVEPGTTEDQVRVTWDGAVDDRGVAGYNIYRNRQYIATRFQTEYVGTVDAGSTNAFTVVTFDIDGNFSIASEAIILGGDGGGGDPGEPPSIPTGLVGDTVTADGRTTVTLGWQPSTHSVPVAGYNVYRNNAYLTTVRDTRFVDTVTAGEAFSYSIVAFDDFGNFSPKSTRLSLLGDANQAPFFSNLSDQRLTVGERFELRLAPVDLDGGAAGILTSALPPGMENVDNFDGSRSLVWTPTAADVGAYDITLTAFDLLDTDLRTSETITLTVLENDGTGGGTAPFSVSIPSGAYGVREGDETGTDIPVVVGREAGFEGALELSVEVEDAADAALLEARFAPASVASGETNSTLTLVRRIDTFPIRPRQSRVIVSATDGTNTAATTITVQITPTDRDDIYLLLGQSNMVGFSQPGAKQTGPGEPDALVSRVRQLNVTPNERAQFPSAVSFTDPAANVAPPPLVTAEDPLHEPVDPSSLAKEGTTIGPGLTFGKQALNATTRNVVLVPAAWSSSGFCNTTAIDSHWNPDPPSNPNLGNTELFDRAVTRANEAIARTGGILRGILWLQGEADGNSQCAPLYEANLVALVAALRTDIDADARGVDARGPRAPIPFVVGTLSRGVDPRGDFSDLSPAEATVDGVHKSIASLVPYADVSLHDDLVPSNGFACGIPSCVHFGAEAYREIGVRFYAALLRAGANAP